MKKKIAIVLAIACTMGLATMLAGCSSGSSSKAAETVKTATGSELTSAISQEIKDGIKFGSVTINQDSKGTYEVTETHTNDSDIWVTVTYTVASGTTADLAMSKGVDMAAAIAYSVSTNPHVQKVVFNCKDGSTECYQVTYAAPSWPKNSGTVKDLLDASSTYTIKGYCWKGLNNPSYAQSK